MTSVCALVITRGRSVWLERCVKSLFLAASRSELPGFTVQVCVNGVDPESLRKLSGLQRIYGVEKLRYSCEARHLTPSAARNRAVQGIESEWVYFVDDDAFVPEEHFERFSALASQYPGAAAIGGPNLAPPESGTFQLATDAVLSCRAGTFFSVGRYRGIGSTRACGEESLILCNLFVRRSAIPSHPFPENFVCAEENAFLYWLESRGERLLYSPSLFNWHERRPSLRLLFRQVFKYGHGRSQFLLRHPLGTSLAHLVPAAVIAYSVWAGASAGMSLKRPDGLLLLGAFYALSCVVSLLARKSAPETQRAPWWSVALFPVIHSGYGMGFLYGLFRREA